MVEIVIYFTDTGLCNNMYIIDKITLSKNVSNRKDIPKTCNTYVENWKELGNKSNCFCSVTKADNIYIMIYSQCNGGGTHSCNETTLFVFNDIDKLRKVASNIYREEHNRDDECEECINNKSMKSCRNKFLEELKDDRYIEIENSSWGGGCGLKYKKYAIDYERI
jgi:hypothetical protein